MHYHDNVPKVFYSHFLVVTNDSQNLIKARKPLVVEKCGVTSAVDGGNAISNQNLITRAFGLQKTTSREIAQHLPNDAKGATKRVGP